MKKFLILVFILILSACAAQVTVTSKVTVTSSQTPPLPRAGEGTGVRETPTPEPTISPEVLEKFEVAGIDLKDMVNAKFDNTGLHITLENGEVVDVKTEELANFVNLGGMHEGKMYGEDHYLPVYNEGTGLSTIYEYDKNKKEWFFSETLSLLEISTDPNNPSSCTARHIFSGAMGRELEKLNIIFPEGATNTGWENKRNESSNGTIVLNAKSKYVMQLANICKVPDDFLGLPNKQSFIASVAHLNTDGSIGFINFLLADKNDLNWFLDILTNSEGTGTGIRNLRSEEQIKADWNHSIYGSLARLYKIEGNELIKAVFNKLRISGIVDNEIEKLILLPGKR